MQNRRTFIKQSVLSGAMLTAVGTPLSLLADNTKSALTVLHTNDVHSHIEPFADDDKKYPGLGGAAQRAAIVHEIRKNKEHVLLLDAGDIFQGTPYFNFFNGDIEIDLMNKMGYDAATIGNHDFDGGIDGLAKQITRANFPFVNCNYDFTGTPVHGKVHKHIIIKKGKLKIGITGCGVELDGLVPDKLYTSTKYLDPIACVQEQVDILKHNEKCHLIICLSHLGYQYQSTKISDIILAQQTNHIDVIIGGHTHTFLDAPVSQKNKDGKTVYINQVGWAGIQIGQLDYLFEKKFNKKLSNTQTVIVDKKTRGK
ncbi:MAG TPA: metallophosphoesterase [Chitinophagales bacterium]|nr:metallophosphoesterase [Chitinophagales bacterium]HMX60246.1 metallophosphoesterase [Chitinophagales bacterium]HMZ34377.1 metallophosphoesterase [Chitinophagales bacterium]HNA38438.1 metallophosphoesterase [Chitinophagales bacterium]HNG70818.1 metallophosphoesterase [Chitinophagales bacterium]